MLDGYDVTELMTIFDLEYRIKRAQAFLEMAEATESRPRGPDWKIWRRDLARYQGEMNLRYPYWRGFEETEVSNLKNSV